MADANILIAVQTLNVNNVVNQLNQIGRAGKRAGDDATRELRRIRDELRKASSTLGAIRTVVTVLGIREAIRGFAELSDSMTNARNRLAIVSRSQQDAAETMFRLKEVALATRSDFDLTTRSYARTAQATLALGVSQTQNIAITKTLQQAIAVSGATNEEAHATLIQLTQAMASNRLSADEFRSVAEQLPVVLDMISKATGKQRVELKGLGEQGKLTAAVMTFSILNAQKDMADAFAKTMPTISQSWTNLGTQVRFAVDQFNTATGASKAVVSVLQFMAAHTATMARVTQDLAVGALPLLLLGLGKLVIALRAVALANPIGALAVGVSAIAAYAYDRRDDFGGPKGHAMSVEEVAAFKARQALKPGTEEFKKAQMKADIERQQDAQIFRKLRERAMADINGPGTKKRGRGRNIVTFEEATAGLRNDVDEGGFRPGFERDRVKAVTDALKAYNGQLVKGDKGYRDLTKAQEGRIEALLREKKAQQDQMFTEKELFKLHFELEKEKAQQMEEQLKRRMQLIEEADDRRRRLATKQFDTFGDEDDITKAREMIQAGGVPGDKQSMLNRLEIQSKLTKPARRQFLEEMEGIGKFKSDIDAIFGPDGSLTTGLSRAITTSIIFHKSFKASLMDLGRTIQAEILQTLIQGLLRMAVLSAMGGGTSAVFSGDIFRGNPYGAGKATGGFVSGPRTRIMGYHHGGEFIVNAAATENNRDVLEAINSGKQVSQKTAATPMSVTVHSYGVDVQTTQTGPNQMVMIARQVMRDEFPGLVAGSFNDPNSRISRSLARNTESRRSR